MIRRTVALLTLLTLLLPAASVWPLGVGNIELRSALNEPLVARIPLRSLEPGDLEGMRVTLGTADQFQRAGVQRPFFLTQLSFDIVPTPSGGYIRVTSEAPVAEPFLNFLLEVNWPRGRVVREYTVLLDPPVYSAAISSTTRRSVPVVEAEPPLAAPAPAATAAASAPAQPVTPASRAVAPGGSYGPVTETDTLWSLAQRFRPDAGYSVQQTMLAILRANPEAFSAENVNTLRAGAILRIPGGEEIASVSQAQALEEVRRQHAQWDEMRGAMAAAPPARAPEGTIASGAPEAAADETPALEGLTEPLPDAGESAPSETDDARLELLGAGSDAAGTVGAPEQATSVEELRRDLNLALEEVEAGRRSNEELSSRLTDAEALIDDLRRLVELKDENIAALQQQLVAEQMQPVTEPPPAPEGEALPPTPGMPAIDETVPALEPPAAEALEPMPDAVPPVEAPAPEPPMPAEPAPAPEATVAAPEPPAPAVEPEAPRKPAVPLPPPPEPTPTSFMDILRETLPVDPLVLGGGVGALLLLGGLAVVLRRRRAKAEERADDERFADDDTEERGSLISRYGGDKPDGNEATDLPARAGGDTVVEEIGGPASDDDERTAVAASTRPGTQREEDDPLAEVNNYLAYEHFDQAEELVRRAIDEHPKRVDYRVRLLDVLRQARDVAGFAAAAIALREIAGADSQEVQKAEAWWHELAPGQATFEPGEGSAVDEDFLQTQVGMQEEDNGIFDVTGAADVASSGVDFDLGFEMTGPEDADESQVERTQPGSSVDFDLGEGTEVDEAEQPSASGVDFVLDAEEAKAGVGSSEIDFDLGFGDETTVEAEPPGQATALGETSELDFDVGGDEPKAAAPGEGQDDDAELGETVELGSAPSPEDDSSLDFELDESPPATDEQQEFTEELDFGLGEDEGERPAEPARAGVHAGDDLDLDVGAEGASVEDQSADLGADEQVTREVTRPSADEELEDFGLDLGAGDEAKPVGDADELDFDLGSSRDAGAGGLGESDEQTRQGEQFDTVLDLDLGSGEDQPGDTASEGEELDFDLGGLEDDTGSQDDFGLDLDLGTGEGAEEDESTREFSASGGEQETEEAAFDTVRLEPDKLPEGTADDDDLLLGDLDDEDLDRTAEVGDDAGGADGNLLETAVERHDSALDLDLGEGDDSLSPDFDFELDDSNADAGALDLSLDDEEQGTDDRTLVLGRGAGGELDEVQTKLDLAQAYIDMGDAENARGILGEVMAEGSEAQQAEARTLLGKLD